jgi:hypothetical protein
MGRAKQGPELSYQEVETADLRAQFLQVLRKAAPKVLRTLRDEVLPTGRPWVAALSEWAKRWHLQEPWLLKTIAKTLDLWDRYPSTAGYLAWALPSSCGWSGSGINEDARRVLIETSWWPTSESRTAARKRIMAMVDARLGEIATAHGAARLELDGPAVLTPPKSRRARGGRTLETRMQWLAEYQVLGHLESEIAAEHGVSQPAVSQALDDLAVSLQMKLRPKISYADSQ